MSTDSKDTIYIDVDEEITGIVSKIQNSPKNIVALVLPKRATVLQSIVNMKLLKRAQDQHDKKLVLITSESRILPLAGSVGLFVASNLTSKPYVPPSPSLSAAAIKSEGDEPVEIDPNTPVAAVAPDAKFADNDDKIEIDNTPKKAAASASSAAKKGKGGKKLKVPNFNTFRKKLMLIAAAGVFLIIALIYGIFIAPKAKVIVKAQTNDIPLTTDFIADTKATEFKLGDKTVRASSKQTQKNNSEKVEATGQKDKGNKASGQVSLKNCSASLSSVTIPAGTGVSSGEYTFVTQSAVTLPPTSKNGLNQCTTPDKDVSVIAQQPGDRYNLSARSYNVSGQPDIGANGSAMSGGTTQMVKVVSQSDVNKAKERLNGATNTTQEDFKAEFQKDGYLAINESFKATPGEYAVSPAVDTEANEVTVNVTITYEMLGVKEDDLKQVIKDELGKSEEGKDQNVLSEGLAEATIKPATSTQKLNDGQSAFTIDTTVVTGPNLNQSELKSQITGKKSGEAEEILKQRPGIEEPKVELSPFWVTKVPKASKIIIEVQQADGSRIP